MKIDAKTLIDQVKQSQSDKRKISLYLSDSVYNTFKAACKKQEVSPSEITEYLMRDFIESLSKGAIGKAKK